MTQPVLDAPRVLLAATDPSVAEPLGSALAGDGFQVDLAGDGLTALQAVEQTRPDLVVVDLDLARMSGRRVVRLLRSDPDTRTVPLVILADETFQEALDVVRCGPEGFVSKQAAPDQVAAYVGEVLRQRRRPNVA